MNNKEQLCPKCQTGKESYELDPKSPMCPHIDCHKDGTCSRFVPLKEKN